MIKKSACIFLFLMLTVCLSADVDEVCEKLAKNTIVTGHFIQTKKISTPNHSLVSKGDFVIAKNSGLILQTKHPVLSTLVAGNTAMIQMNERGEATRVDANSSRAFVWIAETISAVFTGNLAVLQRSFTVDFSETSETWQIDLRPKYKEINAFAKHITIKGEASGKRQVITEVTMQEQKGNSTVLSFSNYDFPQGLTEREKQLFDAN